MATTRLITIHISKGKSGGGSFAARLDYASNPEKTEDGQLVTSFACDPMTAANEFELMRRTYLNITGRHRDGEVIAYQLRQSFKPGEVTPEEANQIGRELAGRFLKGNHAYIVATHTDRRISTITSFSAPQLWTVSISSAIFLVPERHWRD